MLNIYKFLKPVHIYIRVNFFFGNLWCVSDRAYNHEEMVTAEWPWWLNLWSQRLPESQYVHSRHRRRATGKLSNTHHSECLKVKTVHCVPYGQCSDILYSTTAPPATQVWVLTQSTFPIMVPSVSFPLFRSYLYCPMYKKARNIIICFTFSVPEFELNLTWGTKRILYLNFSMNYHFTIFTFYIWVKLEHFGKSNVLRSSTLVNLLSKHASAFQN